MGTAAPRRDRFATVRAVLRGIEIEARATHPGSVKPADLLREALDDPGVRDDFIAFLGPFLSRVVSGSVPDYSAWEPPQ